MPNADPHCIDDRTRPHPAFDPMQGETVKLGSIQLKACYTAGSHPTVVFIHGGLGNRFHWRSQWECLQARGWAALAYDLAGHGESSHYRRYSIGRHRRDLSRLLHHFQIQAPILCCHSYGVPLGLEWAARYPTRGLILIGGGTHNLTPAWEMLMIRLLRAGGHHLFRAPQVQRWVRQFTSQHRTSAVNRFFQDSPLPHDAHPYQAIEAFWHYDGCWAEISCPVLVITGTNDPVFPPTLGSELALHFTRQGLHSQHLNVANSGHLVMVEAPEIVNPAILQLLERVQAQCKS